MQENLGARSSYQCAHHLHAIVCGALWKPSKTRVLRRGTERRCHIHRPPGFLRQEPSLKTLTVLNCGIKFDNWRFEVFAGVFLILVLRTAACRFFVWRVLVVISNSKMRRRPFFLARVRTRVYTYLFSRITSQIAYFYLN
ncbi:hypothetical protein [Klebsiella pneumoniae]|uniref:hypothetical protein n=1 Tax=Klebsiella pneumoniae TaxID=573 RepID=UPI003975CD64